MAVDWGAIASGASNLGASLVNLFTSNRTNHANKDINKAQIEYAREAFEKEKEYNNFLLTNKQQMQMGDAKAAGVNPAFAQGSSLGGATSSPTMQVPNQIPMNYAFDSSGLANAANSYFNTMIMKQEARKKGNEADLTEAQKERQLIENQYLPQLMKSQFDLNTSNVRLIGKNCDLTKNQADKVATEVLQINKQMQKMDIEMQELNARVGVLKEEEKIKAATAAYQSDLMKAQIRDLQGRYKLSLQQAQDIAATQVARIFNLQADTVLKGSQSENVRQDTTLKGVQAEYTSQQIVESKARTSNIAEDTNLKAVQKEQVYWNAQQNKLDFEIDKDYKRTERSLQMAKCTAETANAAAQAAKNTVDAIKPW